MYPGTLPRQTSSGIDSDQLRNRCIYKGANPHKLSDGANGNRAAAERLIGSFAVPLFFFAAFARTALS